MKRYLVLCMVLAFLMAGVSYAGFYGNGGTMSMDLTGRGTLKVDDVSIGTAVHSTGHGSPEGVVAGNVGDEYRDLDTGTVYNKTSGTGSTGWEAGAGSGVTPVANLVSYSGGGSNAIGNLGATPALDPSLGAYQTGTVNLDISSMTIASGKGVVGQTYKFELTISGTRTITWPVSGFSWMAGAPTVPADGHKLWVVLVCTAANTYEASWFDDSYYTMPASGSTIPASTTVLPVTPPASVDGSAGTGPTAAQMGDPRCSCTNYGQAASDVAVPLPTAAANLSCLFQVGTAQSNKWGVQAGASDKIYLIAADGTISAGSDNGYARFDNAVVGQSFACWSFTTGAGAFDWMCKAISIGSGRAFAAN